MVTLDFIQPICNMVFSVLDWHKTSVLELHGQTTYISMRPSVKDSMMLLTQQMPL